MNEREKKNNVFTLAFDLHCHVKFCFCFMNMWHMPNVVKITVRSLCQTFPLFESTCVRRSDINAGLSARSPLAVTFALQGYMSPLTRACADMKGQVTFQLFNLPKKDSLSLSLFLSMKERTIATCTTTDMAKGTHLTISCGLASNGKLSAFQEHWTQRSKASLK